MLAKRITAAFLTALFALLLWVPASAEEWKEEDLAFTVPEEFVYRLTPSTPPDDPAWALAGAASSSAKLEEYMETGVIVDLYTQDKLVNVQVMQKSNDYSQNVYNIKGLDEQQKQEILGLLTPQNDQITVSSEFIDVAGQPFYRFQIDGEELIGEVTEIHELLYGTIVNGHTLNFSVHQTDGPLTDSQVSLLEEMVRSVRITQVLEKPEPDPTQAVLMLALLGLLALAVVGPLLYLPIRSRHDKRVKAQMADRLSEYHKTHPGDTVSGDIRFANSTDCTREAVHSFSLYQAYVKGLPSLLVGTGVCVLLLTASFLLDAEWWVKLVAVGVTVYYGYKFINMPASIERVQDKVFGRGSSSTAHYAFYDEAFRVSGVQSASVYPYFQITDVRRHGHYLYLYYGPENAYLVDKFGFSLGECEAFEAFIREKVKK